jgi:hypothetical protein
MVDMFRFEYPNPTTEALGCIFEKSPTQPSCASPFSKSLEGQSLRIACDSGLTLSYDFKAYGVAALALAGGEAPLPKSLTVPDAEVGILELDRLVLLAHLVPGTCSGLLTVLDLHTSVATVFEVWMGSRFFPTREVQRVIHHGYIDKGAGAPAERHMPTRRLTGKGILWEDDTASKLLTVYASAYCSSFVEVGVPNTGDTFTAPSDYLAIDERFYIYSRVEVEFSGALVLDVIDLFNLRSVGVRLGLDEDNRLQFRMVRARGKLLGQLSVYGRFGVTGHDAATPLPASKILSAGEDEDNEKPELQRGFRPAYRPFRETIPMTLEEVDAACRNGTFWVGGFPGPNNEHTEMMLPNSDMLVGKKFTVRFDGGPAWEYEILDKYLLRYRAAGKRAWQEISCRVFESDDQLALLAHPVTGTPLSLRTFALDLRESLVTCVLGTYSNPLYPREPVQEFLFGVIEGDSFTPPKYKRHGYTTELVGRSYTWSYTRTMMSQHIYSSPWSYSWTILMEDGTPGVMWSSPCRYAKIREGVYMMSWVEERSQGGISTFLFNTKAMHDCGAGTIINHGQVFELNTFGAESRFAGKLELGEIYGF